MRKSSEAKMQTPVYDKGAAAKGEKNMSELLRNMQTVIDMMDACIKERTDAEITLQSIAGRMGYSPFYFSRKFREVTGMQFRHYLRFRKLALAVRDVRDSRRPLMDIALDWGFSTHGAFTRAFRDAYGVSPSEYRRRPVPLKLRTIIKPFDCYLIGKDDICMTSNTGDVNVYFVTLPAHKFLYIRNLESIGYFDFWEKQSHIPGQDCETICGLLESIPGKLDDRGTEDLSSGSGQLMAWQNDPEGRVCSWGIPLAECYGVRLPADWQGEVPGQMLLRDVEEGEYIVFEHGPFDYATQTGAVEKKIEQAMKEFDWAASDYQLDLAPGRFFYFYMDPAWAFKYVRPVCRKG